MGLQHSLLIVHLPIYLPFLIIIFIFLQLPPLKPLDRQVLLLPLI